MTNILFKQHVAAPDRPRLINIDRPDMIVNKADHLNVHGFWFGAIADAQGNLTLQIEDDSEVYAAEICHNVRQVGAAVDRLIVNFDLPAALKKRKAATKAPV